MEKSRKPESASNNRGNEGNIEDSSQPSPGSTFSVYILMEDLIDKMKLLKYDSEFVKEFNIKPFPR